MSNVAASAKPRKNTKFPISYLKIHLQTQQSFLTKTTKIITTRVWRL